MKPTAPDLILEGSHLGRGIMYFDEEVINFILRLFQIIIESVATFYIMITAA